MKKGVKNILVFGIVLLFIIGGMVFVKFDFLGGLNARVIGGFDDEGMGGPSAEQQECLKNCVVEEGKEESVCMAECGTNPKPEPSEKGEVCMQECVSRGCEEHDFQCQLKNKEFCEDECGMKGDAPDEDEMSEAQKCISDCVAQEDETVICGNSKEGETGNALCQRCADECVYLYAGPCLNDEQITEKEEACKTCEHCYGKPVEGPSGQGWDCIVDVKCSDASAEFGDDAGEGPGIGQEGFVAKVGEGVGNVIEGIGDFFKGLFGGGGESDE